MTIPILALALAAVSEPRLIAQLTPGADPAAVATKNNVVLLDVTPNAPFALYGVTSGTVLDAQARLQNDTADVVFAEDDVALRTAEDVARGSSLSVVGDRSGVVQQDGSFLSMIGWSASLAGSNGRTVRLAILDDGLSRKQTALWDKVDASFDAFGGDADDAPVGLDTNGDGRVDGGLGHGTMVAGIADVVAPSVRLVVAKVADADGQATSWNLVKGMAFAVSSGAEVANVSLGSPDQVAAFNDTAEWATSKGLLVVAAAGNAGTSRSWYPARSSKALCVVGLNLDATKASFSNWDGAADAAAPAVGIVSQFWDGSLASWSGTSFASPFVAAAVADCLRRTNRWKPNDLVNAVKSSGQNIDKLNAKDLSGQLGTLLSIPSLNKKLATKP